MIRSRHTRYFFVCLAGLLCFFNTRAQNCQALKGAQTTTAGLYYCAENLRSDTFDILKYTISLEIGNSGNSVIGGNTQVRFAPRLNGRTFIRLDLLRLTVDSVKENSNLLSHSYNDTVLKVNFTAPKNTTDTSVITVFYHGSPQIDATGWGGFYFDNTQGAEYAWNLGIGFGASPHNYGRVWFPCFDNFVERSRYEFNITCDSTRRSFCNGQLMSDVVTGTKRKRQWVLNKDIPSYLASVTLANYTQVNWQINTLTGNKPIVLAAVAADTSALKAGFVNLPSCIHGFENYYGPYAWNRFGYCVVPFNSGAMEHATNITYPRNAVGVLAYEADLMAHELSHHWWGDLVTCETQEDMWLNEGMATYSSYLFQEWQYGKARYLNAVKPQHDDLLHYLHKRESGFRAISGVPHALTYGDHVYLKGADVAHTLRGYMGDSAFFAGAKYTLQQNAFKSMNSNEFRDLMQTGSGQNLYEFFANWVFSGGWPHFSIDSVSYIQQSPTVVNAVVSIHQKLFGAPAYYNNVPLELSFFKSDWSRVVRKIVMSGATQTFTVSIPYNAVYCGLNYDSKISDATSHEVKTIKAAGSITWSLGKMNMTVISSGSDSSLIRVIHNYVKPDAFKNNPQGHLLSDQHFWKIEGLPCPGFYAKGRFYYDGTKITSGNYAYLDTLLTAVNGNDIGLFYRRNTADDWRLLRNIHKVSINSKTGYIDADSLKLGEYTFGNMGDTTLYTGIRKNNAVPTDVKVFPNPARHSCTVELSAAPESDYRLTVIAPDGKTVITKTIQAKSTVLDLSQLPKGAYLLRLEAHNTLLYTHKLLME